MTGPKRRRDGRAGTVYLLHFDPPYRHARHYLGFTAGPIEDRVALHITGQGARLVEVAVNAGCSVELARTWPGSRTVERQKKRQGGAARCCPICRAAGLVPASRLLRRRAP